MEWFIGITCSLVGVIVGFGLDRLWSWWQNRKAGLFQAEPLIYSPGAPHRKRRNRIRFKRKTSCSHYPEKYPRRSTRTLQIQRWRKQYRRNG